MSESGEPGVEARERHVTVPRTARYYALGDAATAREVWVVLHGYGQLASYFVRSFEAAARERLVVAPEALSRFYLESQTSGAHGRRVGATWMTREDRLHEIDDYLRWLDLALADATRDATPGAPPPPLVVLGFSQGTATACRSAPARAARGLAPSRLVLWAGEVPPELDLGGEWLRATRLTLVAGTEDPFATPAAIASRRSRLADRAEDRLEEPRRIRPL